MFVAMLVALASGTSGAASAQEQQALPHLVPAPIEKVFVPDGFDDNDNVQVIIHGHFPSSCYKTGPATARLDTGSNTIIVEAFSFLTDDQKDCTPVVVPFIQPVSVGLVPKGVYQIAVETGANVAVRPLTVAKAVHSSQDDFVYAPVDAASFLRDPAGNDVVKLEGTYPLTLVGCMVVSEVRVTITKDNVVVVQPIMQSQLGDICTAQAKHRDFVVTQALNRKLPAGGYLIHVRTLDATAFNRFVETFN